MHFRATNTKMYHMPLLSESEVSAYFLKIAVIKYFLSQFQIMNRSIKIVQTYLNIKEENTE